MYELLLYVAVGAAVMRSGWLLIGLVRVIPVHIRARTRRWGIAEVLAFAELPVFLALTCLLVLQRVPVPPPGGAEQRFGPGAWYRLAPGELHSARFEVETSEVEFWFRA